MPIRPEVGLEMVLNMGERSEERRLWRLGGMVSAFYCFCTGYEDLDKCSERRPRNDDEGRTEENHKTHVIQSQGTS